MVQSIRLRRCLDAQRRLRRLGPIPRWPLGVDHAVGLDVDRRCTLGLRAVSLWPLGVFRQPLGLDPRPARHVSHLRSRPRRLDRRRRFFRLRRLVRPRPAGTVLSVLSGEPELLPPRQQFQHRVQHRHHQRLLPEPRHQQYPVSEPQHRQRHHRRAAGQLRHRPPNLPEWSHCAAIPAWKHADLQQPQRHAAPGKRSRYPRPRRRRPTRPRLQPASCRPHPAPTSARSI